jgi:Ca-activated chloride channel family protein
MKHISITAAMMAIAYLPFVSFAQTPTPTVRNDDDEIIKVQSRLVVVPVSVTDAGGEPVTGLTKNDFTISEQGKHQVIDQVSDAERTPLEIALLIDISSSVNPLFDFELQSAAQFLETVMKPEDKATVFSIGDQPKLYSARESSTEAAARVRAMKPAKTFTAFYDTVAAAAQYLRKTAPERSRRVIVALTDGEDNWSELTRKSEMANYRELDVNKLTQQKLDQVAGRTDAAHRSAQAEILRDLQNADTVFYSVNPAGDSYRLNKISSRAQVGMERFANETGGTAFIPRFLTVTNTKEPLQNAGNAIKNKESLLKIFRQLTSELRAQYLIQYYSESDFPANQFVKLDVGLTNRGGVRVRARQGYYVK